MKKYLNCSINFCQNGWKFAGLLILKLYFFAVLAFGRATAKIKNKRLIFSAFVNSFQFLQKFYIIRFGRP